MSEISNLILSRFDRRLEPREAFPWRGSSTMLDDIVDANGKAVCVLYGYDGDGKSQTSPGIAERRRMILELPAMLELLRDLDVCGEVNSGRAREILDRINGASK